jgi:hypothetical protein
MTCRFHPQLYILCNTYFYQTLGSKGVTGRMDRDQVVLGRHLVGGLAVAEHGLLHGYCNSRLTTDLLKGFVNLLIAHHGQYPLVLALVKDTGGQFIRSNGYLYGFLAPSLPSHSSSHSPRSLPRCLWR